MQLMMVQVAFMSLWVGLLAVYYRGFFRFFVREFFTFAMTCVALAAILVVVYALIFGQLGTGNGIPCLFWHDDALTRASASWGATLLLGLIGVVAYFVDPEPRRTALAINRFLGRPATTSDLLRLRRFLRAASPPFLVLLLAPAVVPSAFPAVPHRAPESLFRVHLFEPTGTGGSLWEQLDATRSPRAWAFGLLVWGSGIALGYVTLRLVFRLSGALYRGYVWLKGRVAAEVAAASDRGRPDATPAPAAAGAEPSGREPACTVAGCPLEGCPNRPYAEASDPLSDCAAETARRAEHRRGIWTFLAMVALVYATLRWVLYPYVSPAFAICALLGIVATGYSVVAYFYPRWKVVAVAVIALWFGWANSLPYKVRFPAMEGYYPPQRPVPLREVVDRAYFGPKDAPPPAGAARLAGDEAVLNRWLLGRCLATGFPAVPVLARPKLVVVAVSGGAARSAFWTAVVLDRLEREIPDFGGHVRVITGASGGMLGTAYYVAHCRNRLESRPPRPRADPDRDPSAWVENVPHDSLRPVARALALREPWAAFFARTEADDRGVELERDWAAIQDPIQSFYRWEAAGQVPSLIFSPMMVEDGRRLLISNLDLWSLTGASGGEITYDDPGRNPRGHPYSLSALEFYRLFPDATGFRLATAVRMSASFPFVSPAVNLPTDPPRRVVDAGYYDNYGIQVAGSWIYKNRAWLTRNTAGVALVQVRDQVSQKDRLEVVDAPRGFWAHVARGFQFFTSPADGLFEARYASGIFRNDTDVQMHSDLFTAATGDCDFFTTIPLENSADLAAAGTDPWADDPPEVPDDSADVAMDWYLSRAERESLIHAIPTPRPGTPWTDRATRLARIQHFRDQVERVTGRPRDRLFKKLERIKNYERLVELRAWWASPPRPCAGGSPGSVAATRRSGP
jgi:predicted acylesterase/phospholipase RssA